MPGRKLQSALLSQEGLPRQVDYPKGSPATMDFGSIFDVRNRFYVGDPPKSGLSQVCGKALVGRSWHIHHCVGEKAELHGQRHSCPCGYEWTNEEQQTLAPYLTIFVEAG
jgi:hypothetical protein